MMNLSRTAISALAALGLAAPLAAGLAPAAASEDTEVPTRNIDLNELPAGGEPMIPWLESESTIHTPGSELPVSPELDVRTFAPIGPEQFVALDDTTGDGSHNRLVRIDDQGTTEIAEGPVTRPFVVSDDGERIAWSEWTGDNGRLVLAESDTGKELAETPIDAETYTVGFSEDDVIVEQPSGGPAQIWTPGDGVTDIDDTFGATATDPQEGLASVMQEHGELTYWAAVYTQGSAPELWRTYDAVPVSFSPDGRYVWARDTGTDDALPSSMFLLDAETGEKIMHVDVEGVTQRVSWEPGGSIVFDTWTTDGEMALVRCSTAADGDCELATDPEPSNPGDDESLPYRLAERF